MKAHTFKTNIKCTGCVAKVTPFLNEAIGDKNWQVDYNNPQKILSVETDIQVDEIIKVVERAGFKAEKL
ncbi:MAG: cation transporter [Cyclobacteriaceae bacterium]|jgi:copper chaperone|nr:cation transporter [Cyclobacteriaceae bacterium]